MGQRALIAATLAFVVASSGCDGSGASGTASPFPTNSSTVDPTISADPTPSETPFNGLRDVVINDTTAIARLAAPRTGEDWHEPVPLADLALFDTAAVLTYLDVGDYDGRDIVVAVDERFELDSYVAIRGLFTVGGDSRLLTCPSARTTDPCQDVPEDLAEDVVVDPDTFFDTLTYPSSFEVFDGYVVTTAHSVGDPLPHESMLGDGNFLLEPPAADTVVDPRAAADARVLASFGPVDIVQFEWNATGLPGLTNLTYGLRSPYGGVFQFRASDVPAGSFNQIVWDDGTLRRAASHYEGDDNVVAAGSGFCFPGHFSIDAGHVDAQWERAGIAPGGIEVFVPIDGGNLTASASRTTMEDWSFGWDWETGEEIPYPYANDAAFLAANALISVQRPDGVWLLGLRPDATNLAYECV